MAYKIRTMSAEEVQITQADYDDIITNHSDMIGLHELESGEFINLSTVELIRAL